MVRVDKYDNAAQFMTGLRNCGMRIWMVDDQVAIDPKDLLTHEDREQIEWWKSYIIDEIWKEKRRDPGLRDTCARVLERELTARPGVLEARVWDYEDRWVLQVDFDVSDDQVYDTDIEIRQTLSKAVQDLYEKAHGKVRIHEASWWHSNHGEPPMYVLSVDGLDLDVVVAEAERLQEEIDALDMDDYIAD